MTQMYIGKNNTSVAKNHKYTEINGQNQSDF